MFCAPTSGGKSLVADVLLVRAILAAQRQPKAGARRALLVVPFLSMVAEKSEHLAAVLGAASLGWKVKGYKDAEAGSPFAGERAETVAVCTMEKANIALDTLCEVRGR